MTEREAAERRRLREAEKPSSGSDREKAYPEYRSHYREPRGDERYSKRHPVEDVDEEAERQKRREARRAERAEKEFSIVTFKI